MPRYPLVQVELDAAGQPRQVGYKGQLQGVTAGLETWEDTGCWWNGESEKTFYRLVLADRSVREVFYDQVKQQWFLYKTYD